MPLNALIEKLKMEKTFREWEFSKIIENAEEKISCLYIISREIKEIAKAKIYLDQEIDENKINKFGIACLVMNPFNKVFEKDSEKQHFYDIVKFEKYILDKGEYINKKYFTKLPNQRHNVLKRASNS